MACPNRFPAPRQPAGGSRCRPTVANFAVGVPYSPRRPVFAHGEIARACQNAATRVVEVLAPYLEADEGDNPYRSRLAGAAATVIAYGAPDVSGGHGDGARALRVPNASSDTCPRVGRCLRRTARGHTRFGKPAPIQRARAALVRVRTAARLWLKIGSRGSTAVWCGPSFPRPTGRCVRFMAPSPDRQKLPHAGGYSSLLARVPADCRSL